MQCAPRLTARLARGQGVYSCNGKNWQVYDAIGVCTGIFFGSLASRDHRRSCFLTRAVMFVVPCSK